jgi:hypothetical protein
VGRARLTEGEHRQDADRRRLEGAASRAPDLVPPIDRQYTFQFFTGQKAVTSGDERAFLEWFPYFAEIGRRAASEIRAAVERGGFMATGPAKVIDNAIIGFMQGDGDDVDVGED